MVSVTLLMKLRVTVQNMRRCFQPWVGRGDPSLVSTGIPRHGKTLFVAIFDGDDLLLTVPQRSWSAPVPP